MPRVRSRRAGPIASTPAIRLHTGDVGDGRDMVVVEAVAESRSPRSRRKLKAVRCAGQDDGRIVARPSLSLFHTQPEIGNPAASGSGAVWSSLP